MKKQKGSFIIHVDSLVVLDALTDAQSGQLLRVMRDYHTGNEIECDPIVRVAFMSFRAQFERDALKYERECDRNSANGAKGGRPKKEPTETEKTQSVILKPKKADSDSDNDNESDSDSESGNGTSLVLINQNTGVSKKNTDFQSFIDRFNQIKGSQFRGDDKARRQFHARIKSGITIDEMIQALQNAMKDSYHIESKYKHLTPEFFTRSDKLDRFLNPPNASAIVSDPNRKLTRNMAVSDVNATRDAMVEFLGEKSP